MPSKLLAYFYTYRDFFYPRIIQLLLCCLGMILFGYLINHWMLGHIIIMGTLILPFGSIVGIVLNWYFYNLNGKKGK